MGYTQLCRRPRTDNNASADCRIRPAFKAFQSAACLIASSSGDIFSLRGRLGGGIRRLEDIAVSQPIGHALRPGFDACQLRAISHVEGVTSLSKKVGFNWTMGLAIF